MDTFNFELTDKEFYIGKRYLDSGRFRNAIEIYDKLINENYKFLGDKDADLLLETSLNNRGCAKCGLAKITNDLALYKDGMSDFAKSIEIDNPQDENEKTWLTAYKNLKFSETEISQFGNQNKPNENADFKSI